MGILRTDLLSHSQLQPTGSVFFDGTDDKITTTGFGNIGTSDFTLECWVYLSTTSGTQRIISANEGSQSTEYTQIRAHSTHGWQGYIGTDSGWWEGKSGNDHSTFTTGWHHVVLQRFGNDGYIFVDGEYVITSNDGSSAVNAADPVTVTTFVLGHGYGSEYLNAGYISNARISMKAVYGGTDFTPPKFELKPLGETYLLCCQSSSSSSEAAVAPSAGLTVTGAAASSFTPDLKKDITDTGVVFDGFGSFATSTYMVPPKGKTTERNRGRALIMAGASSPGSNNQSAIQYFNIQSMGNAQFFGNLTVARRALQGLSSSTRGLALGGFISPPATISDTIDFVTFASTGNGTDFGNLTSTAYAAATASNDTRGLFAGGYRPNNSAVVDSIDYVTIATAGNAADFGDLLSAKRANAGGSNTTRAVFAGGTYPAVTDVIQYVTIATTGNATDFGDLTVARDYPAGGGSSPTRTCFAGGRTPSDTNIIDFITTATTGNATDFGDSQSVGVKHGLVSNLTRGVICSDASITNTLEYITFASTGDALDFGDQMSTNTSPTVYSPGACSDSHGGLS